MATGRIPTTANSPLTAKGDLFTFSTGSAKLAVGSNGDTLVADSSATTGLRWTENYAAGKNKIINGDFGVWQRGTSFTLTTSVQSFTADRFRALVNFSAGTSTASQQTFTPGTAPVAGYEGQYFHRISCGSTATYAEMSQMIEDVRTFAGQTITVSFWAKASTGFTTGTLLAQNFGSGGSSEVTTSGSSITLTTSWARYTTTISVPSITGKTIGTSSYLRVYPLTATATLNSVTIDYWGVQVEESSVATAFQTATGTIQGELAACQRYYVRSGGTSSSQWMATAGISQSTTKASIAWQLPVPMRVAPTSVEYSSLNVSDLTSYSLAISALVIDAVQTSPFFLTMDITNAVTATQYRVAFIRASSTSSYLAASAEL
jgi:hypothetical protein